MFFSKCRNELENDAWGGERVKEKSREQYSKKDRRAKKMTKLKAGKEREKNNLGHRDRESLYTFVFFLFYCVS